MSHRAAIMVRHCAHPSQNCHKKKNGGTMKTFTAEPLIKTKYLLGESPFYDPRTGKCSFVDIIAGKLYVFSKADGLESTDFGQQIGAAVPAKTQGEYVVCGTDGLYVYRAKEISKIRDMTDCYEPHQRSNDAKADPKGRLFLGSSVWQDGHDPSGNLFRLDKNGIKVIQENTRISNGLAWSADRKRFFFSDSPYNAIFTYDYDESTGDISGRKVLFEVKEGVPDGMCIDSEDNLWVAVWGGSRIEKRSTVTGELLAIVNVPAEHTTSCCFYGDELDTLLITSSGDGLSGESDGYVFSCKVDAKGCPPDYADI